MKTMKFMLAGLLAIAAGSAVAQAPAGAPAGATGICKDGTYSMAASKSGACGGHKGVQTWYAAAPAKAAAAAKPAAPSPAAAAAKPAPAAVPAPVAAAKPAPVATPAPAPAAKAGPAAAAEAKTAAPGGGPGLVWVNTTSNVYHCSGSTYYGKTKAGKYMSEADATAAKARPNGGKPCSK